MTKLAALSSLRKFVDEHPNRDAFGEYNEFLSMFTQSINEDPIEVRKFLWELIQSDDFWRPYALMHLKDPKLDRRLSSHEYTILSEIIDSHDQSIRADIGSILGRTFVLPNPLLLKLIQTEPPESRSSKIAYYLGAGGLNPLDAGRRADRLNLHNGVITEEMLNEMIRQAKKDDPRIWTPK